MIQQQVATVPTKYPALLKESDAIGFSMPSDRHVGTLLKTLVTTISTGRVLELGTGMGLSLAWMVDGLASSGSVISIDNDPELIEAVQNHFKEDQRVQLICVEGGRWLEEYNGPQFDLVFADAWPGKYSHLDQVLGLVRPGGYYVIDDMKPQENWPEGHHEKALALMQHLETRKDLVLTKMDWSTGIILAVKKTN